MPARNWARPPNVAANGNRKTPEPASPYQPARLADTMNVAAANPNRPRIDGAAIGCRTMRVRSPTDGTVPLPLPLPGSGRAKRCWSAREVNMVVLLDEVVFATIGLPGPAQPLAWSVGSRARLSSG